MSADDPLSTPMPRAGHWSLVTAAEMQALDRETIEERSVSAETLMERAGRALLQPVLALRAASPRHAAPIRLFCGAGNNGGDGFVLARHLMNEGHLCETLLVGDVTRLSPEAAAHWQRLVSLGASCRTIDPASRGFEWTPLLRETSVAVDALFGVGLTRDIGAAYADLIDALRTERARGLLVLSVDMPSGIDSDTGQIRGRAVQADRTVTISLPKVGLTLEPGRSHAGEISVARIGIADPDPERLPRIELWSARAAVDHFPERAGDGHKGRFGRLLVVAGSKGMTGAASLTTRAALRAGSGLVTLAHPAGLSAELRGLLAEVMTAEVAATGEGGFAEAGTKTLEELAMARDVVAVGPGLGRHHETMELVRRFVTSVDRPLVVDADALHAFVDQIERLAERSAATVLTPHPGEAARLLGTDASAINADRISIARKLSARTQSTVLLKGAGTVIADPTGRTLVVPTGGPALATGGTGDVLTGVVAALLGMGLSAFEAAGLAAWWHGASADRLDARRIGFGLLASEVADGLPACAGALMDRSMREADGTLVLRFPDA